MTNSDRLKKLENGHRRHTRSLKELREMIREGLEAHEQRMEDFDRQLDQDRKEHRQQMKDLDERILNLVSAIGDLIREFRGGREKA